MAFSQPITKQELHEYLWNGFDFPKKDSSQLKKDEGSVIQWGDIQESGHFYVKPGSAAS